MLLTPALRPASQLPQAFVRAVRRDQAAALPRRAEAFAGVQQLAAAVRRMGSRKPGNPVSFDVQPDQKWWSTDTSAIVTGANKGIGWDIARILSEQGLRTVLTSRREDAGKEAVNRIKAQAPHADVTYAPLDISQPDSVNAFASWAQKELGSSLRIVVNNAGIASKGDIFGAKEAQETLDTNFYGTRRVCEAMTPLMSKGGRIINVCSMAGKQRILKADSLLQKFQGARNADDVAQLAQQFVSAVSSDSLDQEGWPRSMYGVSKLCEATFSRCLAEQLGSKGIDVNACCPGYVATDMSSWRGYKHSSEGADTPSWLALLAPSGTTGKFFSSRQEESF